MSYPKILLVDDDVELVRALAKVLEKADYEVACYPDAPSAIRDIRNGQVRFDVVLTDVCMPGMKGTELLAILKTEFPAIPVIILTAFGDWGEFMDTMKQGAFAYLDKPINKNELLKTVRQALQATPA